MDHEADSNNKRSSSSFISARSWTSQEPDATAPDAEVDDPPTSSTSRLSQDEGSSRWSETCSDDGRMQGISRRLLHNIKTRTKAKTSKILKHIHHQDHSQTAVRHSDEAPEQDVLLDPAFNPMRMAHQGEGSSLAPEAKGSKRETLRTVIHKAAHPIDAIKSTATKQTANMLSRVQHPAISHRAELEFLQSHCDLPFRGSASFPDPNTLEYKDAATKLELYRESTRVAWITSEHVRRVRVAPNGYMEFPHSSSFKEFGEDGNGLRFHWAEWIGNLLLYYTQDFTAQYVDEFGELPFDPYRLKSHAERLVMASAPWQSWLMHVRRVFRWEDPAETSRWLLVYIVLWYTQNVVAFLWAYVIYMVIYNRYHPQSLQALQESIERNVERNSTASRFGELLDKHGRDEWLGHVIENVGPFIQLQIGDLADLLEILSNFYAWKSPKKTAASIFLLMVCLVMALVADMAFCMKMSWFLCGGAFFFCWPIAGHYPKYRLLVSPARWVVWGIPTYTEWSFQYLRHKAQLKREEIIVDNVETKFKEEPIGAGPHHHHHRQHQSINSSSASIRSTLHVTIDQNNHEDKQGGKDDDDDDDDFRSVSSDLEILDETPLYSIHCEYNLLPGRLIISPNGLRFVQSLPHKREVWYRSFMELVEMRKVDTSSKMIMKLISLGQIDLIFVGGSVYSIKLGTNRRDEVFNLVLGFSGLQWRNI